ncbi:MAG TPA: DNA mismatch repair endonuclease MutL [Chloroflexota bacterium]|nr:DNA mismatch repair endonuclease MutL [Chloroflexota bacterium]
MSIRQLSPDVIAQIAAGEVITRAGDAVKELIENAVDAVLARPIRREAGASSELAEDFVRVGRISIEIWDGGYTRIRVADDGCGIAAEDLPAAFRRHATSKIESADDLERLATLGFRGEALAALAAVADVAIVSATEGAPGAQIAAKGGAVGSVVPQARRTGTSVTVDRLFDRVPARRKYQRAASSETAHIGAIVQAYALAYPEIAFALECDARPVLRTSGSGDLRDVATALFGPEVARNLLVLRGPPDEQTGDTVGLSGLIGAPSLHRATRNGIFLTVNRRPVDSRSLTYAIEDGYATQLPIGRHPVALVDICVAPHEVDANVHPTKREVRLLRDRPIFGTVHRAVRATLMEAVGIPTLDVRPTFAATAMPENPLDPAPASLFGAGPPVDPSDPIDRPRLGSLRILGQIALTYIICEGRAGLYLVDQHAAHERVLLERLERAYADRQRAQILLDPVVVDLPRALRGAADEYVAALARLGFDAALFGDGAIIVRSVPSALRARQLDQVLRETHEALDELGAGPDWRERLALLLSCKTAVKAGQRLEMAEMQALLNQLDEAELCATCSHGRPTALLLSHAQLEREFGRR